LVMVITFASRIIASVGLHTTLKHDVNKILSPFTAPAECEMIFLRTP
jgi:hypothetical protein